MIGNSFENVGAFLLELHFKVCALNMSSFYNLVLKESSFINSNLSECEFSDSDLRSCQFNDSQLLGAVFENSNLQQADFRNALGYSINPVQNKIKKAKFSASEMSGLLDSFNIEIE